MTNPLKTKILFLVACILLLQGRGDAGALVVGRTDDFEDGTVQRWSGGGSQQNVFGGGPAGEDDSYLEIRRPTPEEPYPFHVGTKNTTIWTGDYLRAGVRAIQMDVRTFTVGFGPENLSLRIVLFGPGGAFSSKEPTTIVTEDGWQRIEFGLTRSELVRVFAGGPYQDPGPEIDD
ncbi:MAG: hypothetical protein ACYS14_09050, partial [Planctomycetota bacterium]